MVLKYITHDIVIECDLNKITIETVDTSDYTWTLDSYQLRCRSSTEFVTLILF